MILSSIRKYLFVATAASILANATLFYAWRGAVTEQEVIREQAIAEALLGANERAARAATRIQEAATLREAELRRRINQVEQVAASSAERAEVAEANLQEFATEQLSDETPEFLEWRDQPLPSSVVARLRGLQND